MVRLGGGDGDADGGFQALELAVLFPVVLALIGIIVVAMRAGSANAAVHGAVRNVARAASLERDPAAQVGRVTAVLNETLGASGVCIGGPNTSVEQTTVGGYPAVRVTITCMADVVGFGVPPMTVVADAVEPIDRFG